MGDTFFENLFYKQEKQFEKINDLSKAFAVNYCGNTIIRESIFGIVSNYARKRNWLLKCFVIHLGMMNYGRLPL